MVEDLYRDFKYVIVVNNENHSWWHPFCPYEEAIDWAKEYGCEILVDRVIYNEWNNRWESNGIAGGDFLFFAMNDDEAATMTVLRWS